MAYYLHFDESTVIPYLQALNLTPAGRDRLVQLLADFADHPEQLLRDSSRRLGPNSDCVRIEFAFRDRDLETLHVLRFIVSDTAAQFGVLRVVYADGSAWPTAEL